MIAPRHPAGWLPIAQRRCFRAEGSYQARSRIPWNRVKRSVRVRTPSAPRCARVESSRSGSISPLKPVRVKDARSRVSVRKAAAARLPDKPIAGSPKSSSAWPIDACWSGNGAKVKSIPLNLNPKNRCQVCPCFSRISAWLSMLAMSLERASASEPALLKASTARSAASRANAKAGCFP